MNKKRFILLSIIMIVIIVVFCILIVKKNNRIENSDSAIYLEDKYYNKGDFVFNH
jgi:uncharacterized membrane-anchored protein